MDIVTIAIALALIAVIMYALSKLKLLSTVGVIFLAIVLTFLAMALVPALQVEPVYSALKGFFEALPTWLENFFGYMGRLMGLGGV